MYGDLDVGTKDENEREDESLDLGLYDLNEKEISPSTEEATKQAEPEQQTKVSSIKHISSSFDLLLCGTSFFFFVESSFFSL